MWNRDREFSLLGVFNCCNSAMSLCHNIYFELHFLDHYNFLGVVSEAENCWGFFVSLLIVLSSSMKVRKFWLFKLPNGKSVLVQQRQYHG